MINVLVVDDDFRVADLHARYVARVPGFTVAGIAHTAAEALDLVGRLRPDLVLLDQYLPDGLGTELAARFDCDIIMVTAATDSSVVRTAFGKGVLNYLVKPFTEADLAGRLHAYARYRRKLSGDLPLDQAEIDRTARLLREGDRLDAALRKGRSAQTSHLVADAVKASTTPITAADLAAELGLSRATAQRYLADLAADGRVAVTLRYGTTGRPEHQYSWRTR